MKKNKKAMMDYADNNYPYKHEFASSLVKPGQYTKVYTNGRSQSTYNQPIFKFYVYDRLNETRLILLWEADQA